MRGRGLLGVTIVIAILIAGSVFLWRREGQRRHQAPPAAVSGVLGGAADPRFLRALAPRQFDFPRDHGPHPGFRTEWWYFTGNLATAQGTRFGYQLTFFRLALSPVPVERPSRWGTDDLYMAHFALTDVSGKNFRFAERFSRSALGLAGAQGIPFRVWLEDWSVKGLSAHPVALRLNAEDGGRSLELNLRSVTPVVLNGEAGLSRKSGTPGNASYYYSIPRLATSGEVHLDGKRFRVSGNSWLDREWSTSALERDQVGWDWFALQLDDGRDVMFYRLRKRDGTADPFSSGTFVAADGSYLHLRPEDVKLEPKGWWTSPATGSRYPAGWRMMIPSQGLDLEIVPRLANQEINGSFRYWEGAVAVEGKGGSPGGVGYLEMTGYGGAEGAAGDGETRKTTR